MSALEAVQQEWRRRVEAEYRSAASAHCLVLWLMQLGASPTLLHEGLAVVGDELVHAEQAFAVLAAAGGGGVELARSALGLTLAPSRSLEENVALQGVRLFCVGETVAVRLFKRLRQGCTVDVARAALDRVLADEVRHRDLGWLLLEWLSTRPSFGDLKATIALHLPGFFTELRRNYGVEPALDDAFDERWRAWGMMPLAEYREAVLETQLRDYVPRFAEFGIDAAEAWSGGV